MNPFIEKIKEYKIIVASGAVGLVLGLFFLVNPTQSVPADEGKLDREVQALAKETSSPKQIETSEQEDTKETKTSTVTVDVKGAVQKPGIYELPEGSRVHDVVEKAGGLLEEADSKSINLAQKISDEAVVYVALKGEEVSVSQTNDGEKSASKGSKKVNLNKASLADLQGITGIGAKRAQDILDYREANGRFGSVEDLKKVSGIGAKTLEKLKEYVSVD